MTKKTFIEKLDKLLNEKNIDEKTFIKLKENCDIFVDEEVVYQVVFSQNGYECVDYETEDYDTACEMKYHLTADMYACGERDFCYYVKEVKR